MHGVHPCSRRLTDLIPGIFAIEEGSPVLSKADMALTASGPTYQRRRPETSALHQVVRENYLTFLSLREEKDRPLPRLFRENSESTLNAAFLVKVSPGFTARTVATIASSGSRARGVASVQVAWVAG